MQIGTRRDLRERMEEQREANVATVALWRGREGGNGGMKLI